MKINNWVWTKKTETLKPDRKAGERVPLGYLMEGDKEYYPYSEWIKKGYIMKKEHFEDEWKNKVVEFLIENDNRLGKFDDENKILSFMTNNDGRVYNVSYEKVNMRMSEVLV